MVGAISAGAGAALAGGWPAPPCPGEAGPHTPMGMLEKKRGGGRVKNLPPPPPASHRGERELKFPTVLIEILPCMFLPESRRTVHDLFFINS